MSTRPAAAGTPTAEEPDAALPRRARRRRRQEARVSAVHPIARPPGPERPLVVTSDPDVLDDLLRLAATAGGEVEVAAAGGHNVLTAVFIKVERRAGSRSDQTIPARLLC